MTEKPGRGRSRGRATIKDVAARADASLKTVSRVLNNEPNVRPATRDRVLAAMKELDYHPSMSARSLAGRRSYLIGFTYGHPRPHYLVDALTGAMTRCQEAGFQLFLYPINAEDSDLTAKLDIMVHRADLDGLVITPPLCDSAETIAHLDGLGVPYARLAALTRHDHAAPYVYLDDRQAAEDMTDYLISLGHRDIGFISGPEHHPSAGLRLEGYKAALAKRNLPLREDFIRRGAFTFDSGRAEARSLLALPDRPTAIFASNDEMAAGAIIAANEAGLAVPRDLSVGGFDDTYAAQAVWPQLTTIHQPIFDMAYATAGLLLERLQNGETAAPRLFPHHLVTRGSTAPPHGRD